MVDSEWSDEGHAASLAKRAWWRARRISPQHQVCHREPGESVLSTLLDVSERMVDFREVRLHA